MKSPRSADAPSQEMLLERLREAASEEFRSRWPRGISAEERRECGRLRREYRTWARMDDYPGHVGRLAEQVLFTNRIYLDRNSDEFHRFCVRATRTLVELYDEMLAESRPSSGG